MAILKRRKGIVRWSFASAAAGLAALALIALSRNIESKSSGSGAAGASSAESLEAKIRELSLPPSAPPRSSKPIVIAEEEANAYLKARGPEFLPPGVEEPEIRIHADHISAAAAVDFDKLRQTGKQSDDIGAQLLATLFKGKQKVTASGKLETADGHGQVTVQNFSIGDTSIPDWMTKLMLENYLQKTYHVDLSKPFVLPDHVARIELAPGRATFIRSANKKTGAANRPNPRGREKVCHQLRGLRWLYGDGKGKVI